MSESPFSRRAVLWLALVSAISFGTWLVVGLIAPEPTDVDSADADAYSRSAIGHRAFVELLRARGVPVVVSRFDSGARAGAQALLIVAEPTLDEETPLRGRKLRQMLKASRRALLVLPKWTGPEDRSHEGWLSRVEPVPPAAVTRVLTEAEVPASVAPPGAAANCTGIDGSLTLTRPQLLQPTTDGALRPLIACDGGWLLAERKDAAGALLFVLSDPDLLANHGLGDGDNAAAALAVLAHARRGPDQAVVLDETLHGHERVPSLWRELFAFPLGLASLQGLLCIAFLVWAGIGRFGAPVPPRPALEAGKGVLVENTAQLLRLGGHSAYTLARYLESLKYEVARTLHAPPGAAPDELRERLRRLGRRRRVSEDLAALETAVARLRRDRVPAPGAVLAVARRVHRWRQEMLKWS